MMKSSDVRKCVREIAVDASDAEKAHGREDELWFTVLNAIASGKCEDPKSCAREALKTRLIDFDRWRA